ncbi:MAG: XdhC/CoxI family protein [Proteobacteria bacterium]|nr:XdhC/CoxI family protein [Pseudomonadota bacterium]
MQFFEYVARLEATATPFAILTVIASTDGAPGREAFKMCVTEDCQIFGSIGGGKLEYDATLTAVEMLRTGERTRLKHYILQDEEHGGLGMICGGNVDVLIETFSARHPLVIFGGGHIGTALTEFAARVGFCVTVIDNRPEFATPAAHPLATRTLSLPYEEATQLDFPSGAYFVIVTHQHLGDAACLEGILKRPELSPRYIGVIGSSKKHARVFAELTQTGIPHEALAKVNAPIGLDHGGQSANEIALGIAAEIVARKYGITLADSMHTKKSPFSGEPVPPQK